MKLAHTRCSFRGVFGTTAAPMEEWNFNLNLGEVVFADQAARNAAALAMKDAWTTHLAPHMVAKTILTEVKVAQINALGRTTTDAEGRYNQGEWLGAAPGTGATTVVYPLQTALCVTLTTPREGPSGKGRFFLPAPRYGISSSDFLLALADATTLANAAAAFVSAIDAAVDFGGTNPGGNVVVASTKGFHSVVTGVKVGRALDTQTRRRGDLQEGYVTAAVAQ